MVMLLNFVDNIPIYYEVITIALHVMFDIVFVKIRFKLAIRLERDHDLHR